MEDVFWYVEPKFRASHIEPLLQSNASLLSEFEQMLKDNTIDTDKFKTMLLKVEDLNKQVQMLTLESLKNDQPETIKHLNLRIFKFKEWIKARSEKTIAIVGHSEYFREIVGVKLKNTEIVAITENQIN